MTSKDALLKLLMDRPVAYHADLAKTVGSVTAGLFLSQILYWMGKGNDPADWIYKSQADLYQETGLGRYEQETARKVLRNLNVLHEERRGIPAKLFFKVDLDELVRVLQAFYESGSEPRTPVKSRLLDSNILECGNPANNNDGFQQTSLMDSAIHTKAENTAKSTTENTNHHHPVSDHRTVPDLACEKDDDDAILNSQCMAERKILTGQKSHDHSDHCPAARSENPNDGLGPNDRKLITELVSKYREAVPTAKHSPNDHSFLARLYYDSGGFLNVSMGIKELGYRVTAGLTPEKPLTYLRQIIKSAPWDNENETRRESKRGNRPQRGDPHNDNSAELKQRLAEKERKYADVYLS